MIALTAHRARLHERAPVVLAAGGTGGHLFPAEALAHVLAARGVGRTRHRRARAALRRRPFRRARCTSIPSATPRGGSLRRARARAGAARPRRRSRRWPCCAASSPRVVVGFGGYPTVPPLLAASLLDADACCTSRMRVIGRANRFLARRVDAIADRLSAWPRRRRRSRQDRRSPAIRCARRCSRRRTRPIPRDDGALRLLVTGGSQGARIMADIVPAALACCPTSCARVSSCRSRRAARISSACATPTPRLGVEAELAPFFDDLPARIAAAHLVIARAGASTVAELAAIGRPAILVPLPHALDQDQAANAARWPGRRRRVDATRSVSRRPASPPASPRCARRSRGAAPRRAEAAQERRRRSTPPSGSPISRIARNVGQNAKRAGARGETA